MTNYNFESLSSYDFEILSRDLLQKYLKIYLENFKIGRDGGIDLRSSISKDNTVIVQCKHFVNSTYSSLISELKKEAVKVTYLNPARYILVTSQGLTAKNKDEIIEIFSPYIKSPEDILSRENLNNLLTLYPEVEKNHYKLWLSSANVMERVLHNELFVKSEFEIEKIQDKIKLYVQNESFKVAKGVIEQANYCIIAGAPGIGKTTLAEMLIIDYAADDYEIYKITSMSDGYKVYSSSKKQVFYYDDFLGQTSLDTKLNNKEDEEIINFIRKISNSSNHIFLLTTREYILSQAKIKYEKLDTSNFDIYKCVINLSNYNKFDKAKILYNHLFFTNVPEAFKQQIINDKNYRKIIDHKNYSPRIIEWMTTNANFSLTPEDKYIDVFLANLDHPEQIWNHAFSQQISETSRNILIILASLSGGGGLVEIEKASKSFEKLLSQHSSRTEFSNALKELEGTFLTIHSINNETFLEFNNPSIRDFIENYLANDKITLKYLCSSCIYFEQSSTLINIISDIEEHPLNQYVQEFVEGLKVSFFSPFLMTMQEFSKLKIGMHVDKNVSYLYRFMYLLDLSSTFQHNVLSKVVNEIETTLFDMVSASNDKYTFEYMITRLQKKAFNSVIGIDRWLNQFIGLLIEDLSDISSYNILTDLISKFGEYLSPDELDLDTIARSFIDFVSEDVEYFLSHDDLNLSEIDEYSGYLEDISDFLGVDINKSLTAIKRTRGELLDEDDEPDYDDDYDDWRERNWSGSGSDEGNDDKIDSLFETLKE